MPKGRYSVPFCVLIALAVGACDQGNGESGERPQAISPGQVSAGGGTSGEVMARNGTLQPKTDPLGSPVLVSEQKTSASPSPSPAPADGASTAGGGDEKQAGTPGIPEGSEGNVGGTAMGGTTPEAAKTEEQQAPKPPAANDAASKEAEAKAKADTEKQQLEASMDAVAQRWRSVAEARGWQTEAGADGNTSGTSVTGQTQTSAIGLPAVIRSEKLGTAPPSEDVKDPAEKPSN